MEPKPIHLRHPYGGQFRDESIAKGYATRPPYPDELFRFLETLIPSGARVVLDLGCGAGDVALGLSACADQIDAVDPSAAMLKVARSRPATRRAAIRWIQATAEEFEFVGPYALVVAGQSLHWMDWALVPGKISKALAPRAYLALLFGRSFAGLPWAADLAPLLSEFSTNRDYQPYDLVTELTRRNLFTEVGRRTIAGRELEQPLEAYIESFHTRNGFSRERMPPRRADEFDRALCALVLRHCPDGIVRGAAPATVVWGLPAGDNALFT